MTEEIWEAHWIYENPDRASRMIKELQTQVQELESKLKYAQTKAAKLESENKAFKMTIKDMDRRIMRGLKD
jgi:peptidoglycan hydrolase CwlO-like protein